MKAIIKNGIYNSTKCDKCQCEFTYEPVDVVNNTTTCPICGATCAALTVTQNKSK